MKRIALFSREMQVKMQTTTTFLIKKEKLSRWKSIFHTHQHPFMPKQFNTSHRNMWERKWEGEIHVCVCWYLFVKDAGDVRARNIKEQVSSCYFLCCRRPPSLKNEKHFPMQFFLHWPTLCLYMFSLLLLFLLLLWLYYMIFHVIHIFFGDSLYKYLCNVLTNTCTHYAFWWLCAQHNALLAHLSSENTNFHV